MNLNDLNAGGCLSTPLSTRCDATLPDNPACTLNVHFGMLMGVDEFRAEQGFHLGRSRRHQRLMHGTGVVAGYAVEFDAETFDLRVTPGLAVDGLGRDLVLEQDQCVNLVQWWLQHQKDDAFDDLASLHDATFDLDVTVGYATCLTQPVPAIAEPCAGQASDIAYARVCETVGLQMVRRRPTTPGPVDGPAVLPCISRDQLAQVQTALPVEAPDPVQPEALHIPVACLRGLHLHQGPQGWVASVQRVDHGVRPLLLSTALLQTLVVPALTGGEPGPTVLASTLEAAGAQVALRFDQRLAAASVQAGVFAVSEFDDATGWQVRTVQSASYTEAIGQAPTVVLQLDQAVAADVLRIAVIGNGSTPLLGRNLIPAGATHANCDGRVLTTTIHRG